MQIRRRFIAAHAIWCLLRGCACCRRAGGSRCFALGFRGSSSDRLLRDKLCASRRTAARRARTRRVTERAALAQLPQNGRFAHMTATRPAVENGLSTLTDCGIQCHMFFSFRRIEVLVISSLTYCHPEHRVPALLLLQFRTPIPAVVSKPVSGCGFFHATTVQASIPGHLHRRAQLTP